MFVQRGFFLIEIMIALVLLAGMAGIVASYQWHAVQAYQDSQAQLKGLNLARQALESILVTQGVPVQPGSADNTYTLVCRVIQACPRLEGIIGALRLESPSQLVCVEVESVWQSSEFNICRCRLLTVARLDGGLIGMADSGSLDTVVVND